MRTDILRFALLAAVAVLPGSPATAADHADVPAIVSDFAADIGDFYAWHTEDRIVALITVGPYSVAGQPAYYDAGVLFGMHADIDGDAVADRTIWVRLGQDPAGNWGAQFSDIPGETAPLEGPVETVLEGPGGAKAYVGLRDDPFFFDREGLWMTAVTEVLSFSEDRDWLLFKNVTAVIVEFPTAALGASGPIGFWGTTARQ